MASLLLKISSQAKVKIVELSGLPPKGDCVEWIEARNGKPPEEIRAELLELARKAETVREACQATEPNDEDATIARLAALSLIEYERCREPEAEKLGFRKSILDLLVNAKRLLMRPPSEGDNLQGTAVRLVDVEPWPEPVNGAEILDAIALRFERYVVLPEGAADMLALCALTPTCSSFFKNHPGYISARPRKNAERVLCSIAFLFFAPGESVRIT